MPSEERAIPIMIGARASFWVSSSTLQEDNHRAAMNLVRRKASWMTASILVVAGTLCLTLTGPSPEPLAPSSTDSDSGSSDSRRFALSSPHEQMGDREAAASGPKEDAVELGDEAPVLRSRLDISLRDPRGMGLTARVELLDRPSARRLPPGWTDGTELAASSVAVRNTDPDGRAELVDLAPGEYVVRFSELQDHVVPSAGQKNMRLEEESGFDRPVTLQPGGNELDVVMSLAARVEGRVVDDSGAGVEGVTVCVAEQVSSAKRYCYDKTDAHGLFSIRCPSGPQRVSVQMGREHPLAIIARPPPRDVTLAPGELFEADFLLTREGATIRGRVVDAGGQPFSDLEVLCYHYPDQTHLPDGERYSYTLKDHALSVRTGGDGRFVLQGLPGVRVAIQVGPEDYEPGGRGRLGMVGPRMVVDLSVEEDVDLGNIEAHRSNPYRIHGDVLLSGIWEGQPSAAADRLRLTAALPPGVRRDRIREVKIRLRSDEGRLYFDWTCDTPEEGVLLELRGPFGELVQEAIHPEPGGTERIVLRFPE